MRLAAMSDSGRDKHAPTGQAPTDKVPEGQASSETSLIPLSRPPQLPDPTLEQKVAITKDKSAAGSQDGTSTSGADLDVTKVDIEKIERTAGSFGKIHSATYEKSPAVAKVTMWKDYDALSRERRILVKLNREKMPAPILHGKMTSAAGPELRKATVMTEAPGQSVDKLIQSYQEQKADIPKKDVYRILLTVATALAKLHESKYAFEHGDLKWEHVFLQDLTQCTFIDWGEASYISQKTKERICVGSPLCRALHGPPERGKGVADRGTPGDIYDFGTMIIDLVLQQNPPKNNNEYLYNYVETRNKDNEDDLYGLMWKKGYGELANLAGSCRNHENPGKRPTAKQLCDELTKLYEAELTLALPNKA